MPLKVAVGSKNFRDKCGNQNTFFAIHYWGGLRDRRVLFGKEKPFHNQYTTLLAPCLGLHNTFCTPSGHTASVMCCWSILQNTELFSSSVTNLMTPEKVLVWQLALTKREGTGLLNLGISHEGIILPTVIARTIIKLHSLWYDVKSSCWPMLPAVDAL